MFVLHCASAAACGCVVSCGSLCPSEASRPCAFPPSVCGSAWLLPPPSPSPLLDSDFGKTLEDSLLFSIVSSFHFYFTLSFLLLIPLIRLPMCFISSFSLFFFLSSFYILSLSISLDFLFSLCLSSFSSSHSHFHSLSLSYSRSFSLSFSYSLYISLSHFLHSPSPSISLTPSSFIPLSISR